nr:uncharacterized protein LOC129384873 [Dermacentor andersoni]
MDESSDEVHLWKLVSERKNFINLPIRRSFTWGGVHVAMEVDTGSPVCVISWELYMKHRNHWPALKPSRVKLSCYAGRLPVLGDLTLRVGFKEVLVDCPLTVLDCEGPILCGRDLLTLLDNAGAPVLHVTPACGATETSEMDTCKVKAIFTDYQDIFTTELGLMEGPPASLHLKDGAIPKFYHQPLVSLLRPDRQTPTMAATRIQRWALYLGGYKYKLQYVPGPTEGSHDWTLPPDSSVYVRNYGQGEKRIPGHAISATGARMVTVEIPTAIVKRHVVQVRRRSDSSPRFPDTTARGPGSNQTPGPSTATNASTSLEEAAPVNSPDADQIADDSIRPRTPPLPTTLSPAEASQQVLRRSTRQRKPVQRFHF